VNATLRGASTAGIGVREGESKIGDTETHNWADSIGGSEAASAGVVVNVLGGRPCNDRKGRASHGPAD